MTVLWLRLQDYKMQASLCKHYLANTHKDIQEHGIEMDAFQEYKVHHKYPDVLKMLSNIEYQSTIYKLNCK